MANLPFSSARAVRHLRAADPELGMLMDRVGPFKMQLRSTSTFASLARAISSQQLSSRAAATIYGRFCALFGPDGQPTPLGVLALSTEQLRGAGLSGAKVAAVQDLARRTLTGEVPELEAARGLSDEEVIKRLSAVRGVGQWTAQMFLMFSLGRPDVLPLADLGLRRGFAVTFNGGRAPTADEVAWRGEAWRPFRTVASWYLWRAAEAVPLAPAPGL